MNILFEKVKNLITRLTGIRYCIPGYLVFITRKVVKTNYFTIQTLNVN